MGVHCKNFGTELRLCKVWDEVQQLKSWENPVGRADLGCPKLLILVTGGGGMLRKPGVWPSPCMAPLANKSEGLMDVCLSLGLTG